MSKEFGENKGTGMKCLLRGQNGKEYPAWHFEIASLAATAFGSVVPPSTTRPKTASLALPKRNEFVR
jgi:hypothetical protein